MLVITGEKNKALKSASLRVEWGGVALVEWGGVDAQGVPLSTSKHLYKKLFTLPAIMLIDIHTFDMFLVHDY